MTQQGRSDLLVVLHEGLGWEHVGAREPSAVADAETLARGIVEEHHVALVVEDAHQIRGAFDEPAQLVRHPRTGRVRCHLEPRFAPMCRGVLPIPLRFAAQGCAAGAGGRTHSRNLTRRHPYDVANRDRKRQV